MKAELGDLPTNIVIVEADSRLSSYNISELADVALVGWTSMGLELARFGVPVVAAFPEFAAYPMDGFVKCASTQSQYFATLEAALSQTASIASITDAFRWTYFSQWAHLIDLSDLIPEPQYYHVPKYSTPRNADKFLSVLIDGVDSVAMNTAPLPCGAPAVKAERDAIVGALEKLVIYLITGALVERSPGVWVCPRSANLQQPRSCGASLYLNDTWHVSFLFEGKLWQRQSQLLHRLGLILARGRNEGAEFQVDATQRDGSIAR